MNDARSTFLISQRSPGYAPSALGPRQTLPDRAIPGSRRILLAFVALVLAGCGGTEGGGPTSGQGEGPADTTSASPGFEADSLRVEGGETLEVAAVQGPGSADTTGDRTGSADAVAGSPGQEQSVQEEGERTDPPVMQDITRPGQGIPQEVQIRLDRLEAENDSLRAAVGTLDTGYAVSQCEQPERNRSSERRR
jgi:hypothetical protein